MLPALQPTRRSSGTCSRPSTRDSPIAAAHLTLPAPSTSATRLRPIIAFPCSALASAAVARDGRGDVRINLQDAGETGELQHLVHAALHGREPEVAPQPARILHACEQDAQA